MYPHCRGYMFCVPTDSLVQVTYLGDDKRFSSVTGWSTGQGSGNLPRGLTDYIGSRITNEDMKIRLFRLLEAIEISIKYDNEIEAGNGKSKDGTVLRIFVAPEFYFRPAMRCEDLGGTYTKTEFLALFDVLKYCFENYDTWGKGTKPLRDWVFLCGTCVLNESDKRLMMRNTMPAYEIDKKGKVYPREISKMAISNIDGMPSYFSFTSSNSALVKNHFFSKLGLFVEICLEHGLGVLVNSKYLKSTKVAVICAAGMPYKKESMKKNVLVYRNDGMRYINRELMCNISLRTPDDKTREFMTEIAGVITNPWSDLNTESTYVPSVFPEAESTAVLALTNVPKQARVLGPGDYFYPAVLTQKTR